MLIEHQIGLIVSCPVRQKPVTFDPTTHLYKSAFLLFIFFRALQKNGLVSLSSKKEHKPINKIIIIKINKINKNKYNKYLNKYLKHK